MARSKVLLIDNDVLSHFAATNHLDDLSKILEKHSIMLVDKVYSEAKRFRGDPTRIQRIDAWMKKYGIRLISIDKPVSSHQMKEYLRLGRDCPSLDDGERAICACAKHGGEVVVSSNFRDVKDYCEHNKIEYIGTMDVLKIATEKGVWTDADCNLFISEAIRINTARFPCNDINKYIPTCDLGEYI